MQNQIQFYRDKKKLQKEKLQKRLRNLMHNEMNFRILLN